MKWADETPHDKRPVWERRRRTTTDNWNSSSERDTDRALEVAIPL